MFSSDFRDLDEAAKAGNKRADLALRVFAHSVVKYIGSFIAVMNGVDAIVFTAGIGENDDIIRSRIIEHFDYLDTTLDQKANKMHGEERIISTPESKVKSYLYPNKRRAGYLPRDRCSGIKYYDAREFLPPTHIYIIIEETAAKRFAAVSCCLNSLSQPEKTHTSASDE